MTQELVVVDTSGWICFFARKGFQQLKEAIARLLEENRVAITGPVAVELIQGCRDEAEKRKIEQLLEGLHWLSITDDHWQQAAQLAYGLRRKGVTASAIDALIASVVTAYRCSLLHYDRDYAFIAKYSPELKLYHL
jgi:predicted nucleic acid-binding protein